MAVATTKEELIELINENLEWFKSGNQTRKETLKDIEYHIGQYINYIIMCIETDFIKNIFKDIISKHKQK